MMPLSMVDVLLAHGVSRYAHNASNESAESEIMPRYPVSILRSSLKTGEPERRSLIDLPWQCTVNGDGDGPGE